MFEQMCKTALYVKIKNKKKNTVETNMCLGNSDTAMCNKYRKHCMNKLNM